MRARYQLWVHCIIFHFRKSREAQRKATHNEGKSFFFFFFFDHYCNITYLYTLVERRRRDRINELIKMLAMIVPGCQKKDATTGTIVGVSEMYIMGRLAISSNAWVCIK